MGGSESGKEEAETQRPGWGHLAVGVPRGRRARDVTTNPGGPGSPHGAVWPWDTFPCPPRMNPAEVEQGAGGFLSTSGPPSPPELLATLATAVRPGTQSPHPLNGQRALEELATAGAALSPSCPSSPLLFSTFPWAVTHLTTRALVQPSGSCPQPSALSGEPPAALSHPTQPTVLWPVGSRDRAPQTSPSRRTQLCLPPPPQNLWSASPQLQAAQRGSNPDPSLLEGPAGRATEPRVGGAGPKAAAEWSQAWAALGTGSRPWGRHRGLCVATQAQTTLPRMPLSVARPLSR